MKVLHVISKQTDLGDTRTLTYGIIRGGRCVCDPNVGQRVWFTSFDEMKYHYYKHVHQFHYTKERFGRTSQLTLNLG